MDEKVCRHAVLMAAPEDLQVPLVARALAAFKEIPLLDAARLARRCWGFAAQNLSEEAARELVSRLADNGIGARVFLRDSIQELPQEHTVFRLDVSPEGLHLTDKAGASERIPQGSLAVLATAAIKVVTTKTPGMKGLPIGKKKREAAKKRITTSETLFYLDLLTRNPQARYRIDAQNFDYSFLKERMLYDGFGNLKTLLADLVKMAPEALQNKGTRVVLENQPIGSMGYESFADFDRESQWLWNLTGLGGG